LLCFSASNSSKHLHNTCQLKKVFYEADICVLFLAEGKQKIPFYQRKVLTTNSVLVAQCSVAFQDYTEFLSKQPPRTLNLHYSFTGEGIYLASRSHELQNFCPLMAVSQNYAPNNSVNRYQASYKLQSILVHKITFKLTPFHLFPADRHCAHKVLTYFE